MAPLFKGWQLQNERLVAALRPLTADQLTLPVGSPTWPIWASASHIAGVRPYWLCTVFGEPGAETTPFAGMSDAGWEDDLSHPRRAAELVGALESTWKIVDQSVLFRLVTHDAYHTSEISLTLGSAGLGAIDLWRGLGRVVPS